MPNEIEKIPPQNIEAEQSVLGSLLIDKDAAIKITDILKEDDFYKDSHKMIYESMLEIYNRQEPIDILSLTNRLKEKNQLETIGGRTYLATLANSVPTASHVVSYSLIVQRKATLRRLLAAASEIINISYAETDDVEDILDKAEQKLFGISQKYLKQNFVHIGETLEHAFNRIDEMHKGNGQLRGISTGFTDLDNKLAGLQKSDLIILAARPSMGKTTLALNIAQNVATQSKTKIPVGIFSLEMSKDSLVEHLLCAKANVDSWKMRTGRLSDSGNNDDFSRIGQAMGILSEAPIYIDDSATANIMEIRTKARRLQSEHGLGLLIIDYLQLMEGRKQDNRVQEITEITRALKSIARELDIPVIALSQLNRGVESRIPPVPKLSDLRESGSIEQDADVVLFIYREDMYKKDTDKKNIAEIYIAKHRNGPTGMVSLYFDADKLSFKNLDKTENTDQMM